MLWTFYLVWSPGVWLSQVEMDALLLLGNTSIFWIFDALWIATIVYLANNIIFVFLEENQIKWMCFPVGNSMLE